MLRTIEFKLYPTSAQIETLDAWLIACCWIYNQALEQRIKSYKRRKESVSFNIQSAMLTKWRSRMPLIKSCPTIFERDALRRVDRGMLAFFRRLKVGGNPGFPRFRAAHRYNSMEYLAPGEYVRSDCLCCIPKLGLVRFRAGNQRIPATQKLLRIVRRASGWYGQVLVEAAKKPKTPPDYWSVGIDVGLTSFATLSNGKKIPNPRWGKESTRALRSAQRKVSRRRKGSKNRRKAVRWLRRVHERVGSQRRGFAHQLSSRIVRRFGLIAVEDLNVRGMARGRFAKSILDAAWSLFITQLAYKAEDAGRQFVRVNARGTSQVCECGNPVPKTLGDRVHNCASCLTVCDRDEMAARVILQRALAGGNRLKTPVEEATTAVDFVSLR